MVTPYAIMVDGVTEGIKVQKTTCPTAVEMNIPAKDISDRVVTLDEGPRPNYYGGKDNPYEVFKVLEAWELDHDFYLGNVIKYLARAGKKNISTKKEDLQKALVYLQRRIDNL
jgi:hypothetical protein